MFVFFFKQFFFSFFSTPFFFHGTIRRATNGSKVIVSNIAVDEEGCIPTLQSDGKALEEVFYGDGVVPPPSSSCVTAESFEMPESVFIPSTKRLDDEGLERYALSAAMIEMTPNFGRLPQFDGSAGCFRGTEDDGVLGGRNNADVKRNFLPVDPIFDVDVSRTRERPRDEARHFLGRV